MVLLKEDKTCEATLEFSKTVFLFVDESSFISLANSFSYFFNVLRIMINSLVRTESGNPIIDRKVIDEFNRILISQDTWKQLKDLATLQLC